MKYKRENFNKMNKDCGDNSFSNLLNKKDNKMLRDTYILFDPKSSETERMTAGYTMVYPGCNTNGHKHCEYEEIYYITKGKGVIQIDEEKYDIEIGDCFYIPFGLFHKTFNSNNENLEYFWVLCSK